MRNTLRMLVLVMLNTGAAAAPAPAIDPFIQERLQEFLNRWDGRWTIGYSDDRQTILTLTGRPKIVPTSSDRDVAEMRDHVALMHGSPQPLFSEAVSKTISDGSQQTKYWQVMEGQRVDGAFGTITRSATATFYDIAMSQVPQIAPPPAVRTGGTARKIAKAAYYIDIAREAGNQERATILDLASRGERCPIVTAVLPVATPTPSLIAAGGRVRRVFRVTVTAVLPMEAGTTTIDSREYAIDATITTETPPSSAVVRVLKLISAADGKARIFDPNPMRAQNDFAVRPDTVNDVSYVPRPLRELDPATGGKVYLAGPLVVLEEIEAPTTDLPFVPEAAQPDFTAFKRGKRQFAGAMAYFHIDNFQRHLIDDLKLGIQKKLRVDITAGEDPALAVSMYCDCPVGSNNGYVGLGIREVVFVAEDATVMAHEYGHALLAFDTNGRFLIGQFTEPSSEAWAINEGFGDYWALSSFFAQTAASKFPYNCYGEWANGTQCERIYTDKPSHELYDSKLNEYINGRIRSEEHTS